MKNIVPDYRLDMVGEPCPYPAVATLEAMPQLKKGEILEVVSDCPQSINNITGCRMALRLSGKHSQHVVPTPASTSLPDTPTPVCYAPEYPSASIPTPFAYRSSHHLTQYPAHPG